jgi:hypothetical protein
LDKYGNLEFPTFIDYVLKDVEKECKNPVNCAIDSHWQPYVSRCAFCQIPYTYILSYESFDDDMKAMSLITNIPFTPGHWNKRKANHTMQTVDFLRQLNKTKLERLEKLYALDFRMFNYSTDAYYDTIQD